MSGLGREKFKRGISVGGFLPTSSKYIIREILIYKYPGYFNQRICSKMRLIDMIIKMNT